MSSGFVSEKELDERRKKRQEEWEKVRTAEQPLEAPEEQYDHRSLFERLEEQRKKKDEEYEEAHKLKNMVRGLDDDEVEFLDTVERVKENVEKQARMLEKREIDEFRNAVASLAERSVEERLKQEISQPVLTNKSGMSNRSSQVKLLAGAVVRKRSSNEPTPPAKKAHIENENPKCSMPLNCNSKSNTSDSSSQNTKESENAFTPYSDPSSAAPCLNGFKAVAVLPSGLKCAGILPGLGSYPDSSESEASSDSDCELPKPSQYDLLGRLTTTEQLKQVQHKQTKPSGN